MDIRKNHAASQGQIATANLGTVFQRGIFFQVDPASLDYLDAQEIRNLMPRGMYLEFDPTPFLEYLPDLEAEIFYLLFTCKKNQKDVAKLLGLSQPTVSYRFRRILDKLNYLIVLIPLNLRGMLQDLHFLTDEERAILYDLFFHTNQELVGRRHNVRQSSVKWIFVKTKDRLSLLEKQEPEKWSHHFGCMVLLEKNLCSRIL